MKNTNVNKAYACWQKGENEFMKASNGKNVIISVKGIQSGIDDTKSIADSIELITEGKYYKKEDAFYVTYKESEVTGMEGTTTTLKVSGNVVTLMRFGSINSQFVFERGIKHISYYETPFGVFTVGVLANDVSVALDEQGGQIKVDYEIDIDNQKTSINDFYIQIRKAGQRNA